MVVRSGILQRTLPVAYLLTECTVNQDLKIFDSGNELINKYFMWYVKGNEKACCIIILNLEQLSIVLSLKSSSHMKSYYHLWIY